MYKKASLLLCLCICLEVTYSTYVEERGSQPLHYSTGVSDGREYRTLVHLFNGDTQNTANFTLTVYDAAGGSQSILPSGGFLVGSIPPMGSHLVSTNQTGNGLNTAYLTLEADQNLIGWTQEAKLTEQATVGLITTPFIHEGLFENSYTFPAVTLAANSQVYLGVRARHSGPFSAATLGAGLSKGFSQTTLVEMFSSQGELQATHQMTVPANTAFFAPLSQLFTVENMVQHVLRTTDTEGHLAYLSYEGDNYLDKSLVAKLTRPFTASLRPVQAVSFFHLNSEAITSRVTAADQVNNTASGDMDVAYGATTESLPFAYTSQGSASIATSEFVEPTATDTAGSVAVNHSAGRSVLEGSISNDDARATSNEAANLHERLAFHINGELPYDTHFAQSQLVLNNYEAEPRIVSWATVDEQGNFLEITSETLPPGLTTLPLAQIVGDNTTAKIVLIESWQPFSGTVDLLIHGKHPTDYELLDHEFGVVPAGGLTIGNYPRFIKFWNIPQGGCLGNGNVTGIIAYINRGYRCE